VTRRDRVFITIIAAQLVVGGAFLARKRMAPTPPVPDLSAVDAKTADYIRERVAACRTADDWGDLGVVYSAYGFFPESEACARFAVELQPDRADRAYESAFALERIGLLEEANAQYERAAGLNYPHPEELWYFVGRNWLRLDNADEARKAFEKAGDQPSARYELARLRERAGDEAGALAIADQLSAEYPTAVQPHLLRHRIDLLHDRPSAGVAADRADRFERRLPTPFDRDFERLDKVHDGIGLAREIKDLEQLVNAGRPAAAEPRLRAALAAEWDPSLAELLSEVEFLNGRPAEAARILEDEIAKAGSSAFLFNRLGEAYLEAGKPESAEAAWRKATALGVGAAVKNPYYRLATRYRQTNRADEAKAAMGRAYLAAGHELIWTGRAAEAREPFEEATKADPNLADAWYYLGETNRLTGRPEAATAAYRKCLDLDPYHGRARRGMGLVEGTR
jgi:tetratricopeptide (TPR) repeat protein